MNPIACGVHRCPHPPDGQDFLCAQHRQIVDRALPDRLDKHLPPKSGGAWSCEFTDDELAAISAQLDMDTRPIRALALAWCIADGIRDRAGRDRKAAERRATLSLYGINR